MGSAGSVAAVSAATQEEMNQAMANLSPEGRAKLNTAFNSLFTRCRYEKKKMNVKGKQMAYIETGEGDPIVFIHGNPTSSFMWRNVIPWTEKLGRVIVPDLIGMGDSDKLDSPGPESYQVPEQMQYLDCLLEALDIKENVTLVVHSWGSVLGGSWAERHRDAMKGYVLMEAVFSPDAFNSFSEQMQAAFKMMKTEKGAEMVLKNNVMIEGTIPGGVVRKLSEEEHNEYRRPFLEPGESRRAILSFVRSVPVEGEPAAVHKMMADTLEWFQTTEMPVLFIKGDPGSSVTPEEAEVIRSFKKITEEVVKGKHLLTEDSPDEIGAAIAKWYRTLSSKSDSAAADSGADIVAKLQRTKTAFSSEAGAAGLMDGVPISDQFSGGIALLIIDPQNDFHEGGSLAVPGATVDSGRIVDFLKKHGEVIERVVVSLDTHHSMHIQSGAFWENADGKTPDPFTIITSDGVKAGTWKARQTEFQAWALEYTQKLEAGGRFQCCIWPAHCILGTPGHAVHAPLMDALNEWAVQRKRTINWYFKGQNNRTEMYSALKAEVVVETDPTTRLDTDLINTLKKHDKIVCCGEALSHCLNYSVRDLLSGWPKGREGDIVVLEDGASPVSGFEESATTFLADMKAAGVSSCKSADFEAPASGANKAALEVSEELNRVSTTAFASKAGAAGLMDGDPIKDGIGGGSALFIIDPQNDFHEGGSLAVPGATEDSARIASFLKKHGGAFERVVVTLDTHHSMHIQNGAFWENAEGKMPDPFTIITSDDVKAGTWKARQTELQAWALEYTQKLEAGGRFKCCIWPAHCILGTPGHAVHPPLMDALNEWAMQRKRTINWYFKGQNNRTEMYSALKAEVEIDGDRTTQLDIDLISFLIRHEKVICCGQALSHCLNYSVRDLLSGWPKGRERDIVVLEDGASPVTGFEESAATFLADMKAAGVTICKTTEIEPPSK